MPFIRFLATAVLCCAPLWSAAQSIRIVEDTPAHTVYEIRNDSLAIGPWMDLMVPDPPGSPSWTLIDSDVRTVNRRHPAHEALATRPDTPLAEAVNPGIHRKERVANVRIHLARPTAVADRWQVLHRARIRVIKNRTLAREATNQSFSPGTPLSSGTWYRIPVSRSGIHALDRAYLSALGVPVATIDPKTIQIWATDGHMLPRLNSTARSELQQVPIRVVGEPDGSFDATDLVLFYANGPDRTRWDGAQQKWVQDTHLYAATRYVFLTIGSVPGTRLTPVDGTPGTEIGTFRDFIHKEQNLRQADSRIKSGANWLGQSFTTESFARTQVVFKDTLAGWVSGTTIRVEGVFAARAVGTSSFEVRTSAATLGTVSIGSVGDLNSSTGDVARLGTFLANHNPAGLANDILELSAVFSGPSTALGWLDYIRVYATRALQAGNGYLRFFSPENGTGGDASYRLSGFAAEPMVVDATNPQQPVWLRATASGSAWLVHHSDQPGRQLVAQTTWLRPAAGIRIDNQNIRGTVSDPDYLVVTSEALLETAEELAAYRSGQGWRPLVVTQQQIFNEFSGGMADPVAIRDFARYFYERAGTDPARMPQHLLLFGDTHFDYKGHLGPQNRQNHVITFQSDESLRRIATYGSDDYFVLLDPTEGVYAPTGDAIATFERIDLGVGRIPVNTRAEARTAVDKIRRYEDPATFGDWRTVATFTADDEINGSQSPEGDLHILNADGTAERIAFDESGIRVNKIYLMSYPVVNSLLGRSVPEANAAFIRAMNNGTLFINYSGHGSETLLAAEGLYRNEDVNRLTNLDRLTVFITATCEFGRFDNPEEQSGAENLVLHPAGGAIASFTTTRVVYTSTLTTAYNYGLNIQLTNAMTRRGPDGRPKTLGEIYRETKNTDVGLHFNSRKFVLLGDPALRLGLPEARIALTGLNGMVPGTSSITLRALDEALLEGSVLLPNGSVDTGFNGTASIKVFDADRYVELPQFANRNVDGCYLRDCSYRTQNDVVFAGRVSIENGRFSSRFIVPRDITYSDTTGRILVFGAGTDRDAAGSWSNLVLNGRNPDAVDDGQGPQVRIYLNDRRFADGGLANDHPELIVDLEDESGINTAGAGVGHELIAVLGQRPATGPERTVVLNDRYESDLNDYMKGTARYRFEDLAAGRYRLLVRAWDVFNNAGEAEIEFDVAEQADLAVRHVYNYPNPMAAYTRFVFEHNQAGGTLDVLIRIFTTAGRPVARIHEPALPVDGGLAQLEWDGRDADGNRLASGTYLYHVKVKGDGADGLSETIQKLVILR